MITFPVNNKIISCNCFVIFHPRIKKCYWIYFHPLDLAMNYLLVLLCRVGSSTIWCLWQPLFIQGKECGVARIILQQLSGCQVHLRSGYQLQFICVVCLSTSTHLTGLVINYTSCIRSGYQLNLICQVSKSTHLLNLVFKCTSSVTFGI